MRLSLLSRLFSIVSLLALLSFPALAQAPSDEAAKMLPDRIGGFRAQGAPRPIGSGIFDQLRAEDYGVISHAHRSYTSADGKAVGVNVVKTRSAGSAYSLLTRVASTLYAPPNSAIKLTKAGTMSVAGPGEVTFSKGAVFVQITNTGGQENEAVPADLARLFAEGLEVGNSSSVPVLVLHLPEWERTFETAGYAVSLPALQQASGKKPALDALSFDGGTEAVTARYGDARLVIVEFTTPQHAAENDKRINERITQLRAEGQPVPSAYKRVGNYSVFVFDAPSETAEQLLAGVKYEKDVRWLGRNPHADEIAARAYTNTMAGVIVAVIKTTGLFIVLCLGIGAVLGGVVFFRRRARMGAKEVYSDAGEMVRLNLVEDVPAPQPSVNLAGRLKD